MVSGCCPLEVTFSLQTKLLETHNLMIRTIPFRLETVNPKLSVVVVLDMEMVGGTVKYDSAMYFVTIIILKNSLKILQGIHIFSLPFIDPVPHKERLEEERPHQTFFYNFRQTNFVK